MNTFSLLLANYNNASFLADAWRSIQMQTCRDFEVVIVDDGSTDDSVTILRDWVQQDSRVKLFELNRNFGVGAAKRKCVEMASGAYCGFLDPDDALFGNAIQCSVDAHMEHPDASMIYSDLMMCDSALKPTGRVMSRVFAGGQNLLEAGGSLTHFVTFKRVRYLQTSGINVDFSKAVDVDMYLKLEETGSIVHIAEPLYFYRSHDAGISQGAQKEREAALWVLLAQADACRRRGLAYGSVIEGYLSYEERRRLVRSRPFFKRVVYSIRDRFVCTRSEAV